MHINIIKGFHRGQAVTGIFAVAKPFANGRVNVKAAPDTFGNTVPTPRVQLEEEDFFYCDPNGDKVDMSKMVTSNPIAQAVKQAQKDQTATNYEQDFISHESESDAMDRIQHTFNMLEEVASAAEAGIVRGLVVSGPPGIGKSYGVERVLRQSNTMNALKNKDPDYTIVKGSASAIGLYQILYNYRHTNNTILFDDCDSILFDEVSLNLLKAALDSGKKRRLCWNTESRVLADAGIPNSFSFEGSVIFLTNLDFERTKASKIKDHLNAIMSRCHYLDLEVSNQRDLLLRVKQVIRDGMLDSYEFEPAQKAEVVNYFFNNADYLRELSLRMVTKIADIVKMKPVGWEEFVEATCLKREAKFKRLRDAQTDTTTSKVVTTSKLPA